MSYARRLTAGVARDVKHKVDATRECCQLIEHGLVRLREGIIHFDSSAATVDAERGCSDILRRDSSNDGAAVTSVLDEVITAVKEMAGVLQDVDHNAKDLITSAEETAYSMSRLDSFLQDMANSGKELESSTETANRVALEGTKVVEEMGRENEAILTTVKEAASAVEDLGRWSQEVGKIVEVIRDIADETNLLALNAAIIAAQSGEHGKAFGVVAEEIRGLAERTSSSTKEISDLVRAVQDNVANVVMGMKRSLQRVERGEMLTRNAGMVLEKVFESFESSRSMAKQIATSTFEHKIDSSHVVRSIHRVTDIARRLESHKPGKWLEAGETLATARILKAIGVRNRARVAVLETAGRSGDGAIALPEQTSVAGVAGDDLLRTVYGTEAELAKCISALDEIGERLSSCLNVFDEMAILIRSVADSTGIDLHDEQIRRCWEVTDCKEEARGRCPAYVETDQPCFLVDGAGCVSSRDGETDGQRRCHDCPVVGAYLDRVLSQTKDRAK